MTSAFPARLKQLRLRRRLSCRTLSELCGLSRNAIAKYERNVQRPSLDSLARIADFFELPIDALLHPDP